MARDDSSSGSGERSELPTFATPEKVGRFLVLRLVGIGGMGVVYAAYDPELDRKVAIKLLHRRGGTPENATLVAEGKAMASLAHPNVVAVYDVGMHGAVPFIAMEYIEGRSLRHWLLTQDRSVAEILSVAVEAGRGLAAAHAVGLVHRDFKPDNVLITDSGHANVTDFGLARRADADAGEITGTPAYMSPEQRAGEATDARSDQYSFAVTLHEALFGSRPEAALVAGRLPRGSPRAERVASSLRHALARALAEEKTARFPSMEAFLDEIVSAPRRRRRRRLAGLLGAVCAAVLVIAMARARSERRNVCAAAGQDVRETWSPITRDAVRARFRTSERTFARAALPQVESALDAYASKLETEERAACLATRVRKELSEEALALRSACLHRRDSELRAITELLADADDTVIENAAVALAKLTPVAACASDAALAMQPLPPKDATTAIDVERIRMRLAQVKAALDAGRYRKGLELAEACAADAERTDYLPVRAEALFAQGALRDAVSETKAAEDILERAAELAEVSRHDEIAAKARTLLVWVTGYRRARHEVGHALESAARGAVLRAGRRADLEAALENNVGTLFWSEGKYTAADERFERAQILWTQVHGREHPLVADALNNRGLTRWNAGKLEAALVAHEEALALRTKLLGSEHPAVASSLNNLGLVAQDLGRFEEAREYHRRAVRIQTSAHGELHPLVASAWNNLGLAELGLGETETALGSLLRGYEIRKTTRGAEHPDVANSLVNLGIAELARYRLDRAHAFLDDARQMQLRDLGERHPALVDTLLVEARVLGAEGRWRDAKARATEAFTLGRSVLGPDHPSVFAARAEEGAALLALGRLGDAIERLSPVVARSEELADSLVVGVAALNLCDATLRSQRSETRISELVQLARRRLRSAGARGRAPLARLERLGSAH